jgi:carboxylesterase type B
MRRTGSSLVSVVSCLTTAVWVVVAGLAAGPADAAISTTGLAGATVVHTDKGDVRGVSSAEVDSFLGVRYAKPPVAELRWRPPQPADPWPGIADATQYGNRCPQNPSSNGPLSLTEDCLFLNVQRPANTGRGDRLPVYVFIHGGGFTNGGSNQHDGTSIVQQTGVVVVTINYRLGMLGWLGHPALTAQQGESGNYGLKDEMAALAWVQRNIANFGGDPNRVTIGGESAGALSVCALLSAPGAKGLFSRAIMQSGYCDTGSQADMEYVGRGTAAQAGCSVPAEQLPCLRAADTQTLLTAWESWGNPSFAVSGTPTLPLDLHVAILQGKIRHVPLLIGSNRDEGRTFTVDNVGMDQAGYESWLQDNLFSPQQVAAVEARYPWPADADEFTGAYLTGAILTDGLLGLGGCQQRHLANDFAQEITTYMYEFAHRTGPGIRPDPVGYVWGAGHAAELAYMWPSFDNGTPIAPTFNAAERQLSAQMIAYWGAFVRNGRPTTAGQPTWPALDKTHSLLSLRAGNASTVITDAAFSDEHGCSFWG